MARRNAAVVAMLKELHAAARDGDITDLFVVLRDGDGEYQSCFQTDDLGDLLLQVRTEVIRAQVPVDAVEAADQHDTRH